MKRLSELKIGQRATILSFEKDEIFIKLMEMGCVPGELVKVEQIAKWIAFWKFYIQNVLNLSFLSRFCLPFTMRTIMSGFVMAST